ncbi:hypothetical protein SY88_14580 [Clostridiales bacterium PH28_bin88]|nr:hypothetical protein SY88_14580 [Clostridiales bacterium PH28_bin88]
MLERGKVTNRQAAFLLMFTTVIATAVLFVPAITAAAAKQDGWLSLLVVATTYGLVVALVIVKLGLRFPDKTLVEYAPLVLGPFLGKLVGAGYIFWFVHVNAIIVREFGDFLLSAFLPETPLMAFNIILLLLAALAVKSGLEVICRANEFIIPLFFLSLAAIVALVAHNADFSNLLPLLEKGFKPVLRGGLAPSGWRGEIVVMMMILPYINYPDKTGRYLAASVVLIGVVLSLATVMTTAVMGGLTEHLTFPFFSLARYIAVARFLERMEVLILVMWVAGVTIKVAVFYYAAALGAGQLLGLRDYRPVVLPIGVILAAWSHGLYEDARELVVWLATIWPPYAYTFELIIPSLLLLVAVLRKKGGAHVGR